jgi:hypothetical protein
MAKKIEVELPVIPRDVANYIGHWSNKYSDAELIKLAIEGPYFAEEVDANFQQFSDDYLDVLVRAIVIGYTVEQSPEEKVREYYEMYAHRGLDGHYRAAITQTLDILGIKIEGVNAHE